MQLKSLHLKNIKNHKDYKIDFSTGITAIIGKNGKGKTAILESIGFVLFDYLPYKQKEFITHGSTWGEIKLEFIHELTGHIITIIRRIGNNPRYSLTFNDSTIEGKEDVQSYIKTNLNIDMELEKLYSEIIAIPQGLATAHFLLPKTQRAQIFDSIMGVDIYRKCWSRLVPVEGILRKKIERLDRDRIILESECKGYGEKKIEFEELEAEIENLKTTIEITKISVDEYESEYTQLSELATSIDERNWLEEKAENLKLEMTTTKLQMNTVNLASKKELDSMLNKMPDITYQYNDTNSKLNDVKYGVVSTESIISSCESQILEFNQDVKGYDALKITAGKLEEARLYKNGMIENIAVWTSRIDSLLGLAGGLCPITDDECDKVSCERVEELKKGYEGSLKTSRKNLESWTNIYNEAYRADQLVTKLDDRREQIKETRDVLINSRKQLAGLSKEQDTLKKTLVGLDNDIQAYNTFQKEYDDILLREEKNVFIKSQLDSMNADYNTTREKITVINKGLVGFDGDRLDFVEKELRTQHDTLSTLKERCKLRGLRSLTLYGEVSRIEKQQGKLSKVFEELEKLNKTLDKTKKIRDIFSKVGSKLTNSYLRNVSYEANQIYQELMSTAYESLVWEENYNIRVGGKNFNQLSGGQQMVAAIAVRLSLLKYFSSINLIILDEPTVNLDESRREALAESINNLDKKNQIIVVTHDDTFSTLMDNIVSL